MAGRKFTIISTAVVTAILTSTLWFFAYNITATAPSEDGKVEPAGAKITLDPEALDGSFAAAPTYHGALQQLLDEAKGLAESSERQASAGSLLR